MNDSLSVVDNSEIQSKIFTVRGLQVMLDRDLAELYQVETKVLNQAVKRNEGRFPDDFIFYPSTSSAYKQIGNAVPPVFAWHIAKSIEKFLMKNMGK